MRYNNGLLYGWPYKSTANQQTVDWENPIIDTEPGHIFTSALTGEGKGVSYTVPALLSWPGSVFAIDIKGELCEVTARKRLEMGQQVYVLDPFQVTTFSSDQLNPLDILRKDDPGLISTASELYEMMVSDVQTKTDPFWHKSAKSMLTGITLQLLESNGHTNINFEDVGDRLDNPRASEEQAKPFGLFSFGYKDKDKAAKDYINYLEEMEESPTFLNQMKTSNHRIVRKTEKLFGGRNTNTIRSIQTVASEAISVAEGGQVSNCLSKTTIPLENIIQGKPMTIYFVIQPEKLKSHSKLLKMWFSLLFSLFSKRRNWSGPYSLLLLDEVAQLGYMNEIVTAITLMRTYGVKAWTIWQDLKQFQSTYPDDWETMLNGCRTQLWFGFTNHIIASRVSEIIEGFTKEDLLKMDHRDAVIIRARHRPEIIRRPNYLCHDIWHNSYDNNPYYGAPDMTDEYENITDLMPSF